MSKRRLSNQTKESLKDIDTYIALLTKEELNWLRENYIEPELLQKFPKNYPQEQKQKIWREERYRSRNCLDSHGDYLTYCSDYIDFFGEESGIEADIDAARRIQKFFSSFQK